MDKPTVQWRLLGEALWELFLARLLCLLPMRSWCRIARLQPCAVDISAEIERKDLRAVQWHLRGVARRVPWRADCLPRGLAAMRMLARRGYTPMLVMGARSSDSETSMTAHAWVECAGVVVCGGPVQRGYPRLIRLIRAAR